MEQLELFKPERAIRQWLRRRLAKLPIYAFSPVQTGRGAATVDLLLCVAGRFWAVEVKGERTRLTPRQQGVLDAVEKAGGVARVVRGQAGAEAFIRELERELAVPGTSGSSWSSLRSG
ncbi:MAG TPA: hypothetical protein ENI87_05425 [bacterium]|nr:hypothetical protein [bacterium]